MQKAQTNTPKESFSVQDVLFVLFKHKWKIILFSSLGIGAAAVVFFNRVPLYQSESKLLVRYVVDSGSADPYQSQAVPGVGVDPVINTEIEILTSSDLALKVAEDIGVAKLVPDSHGNATLSAGAGVILSELVVSPGFSNNILHVTYANRDPELSKLVLKTLVDRYFEKHLQIHRSAAEYDLVAKQTEEVRLRLKKTEEELNKVRTDSGILSLADATTALSSQRAKTQEDLMNARAQLAEQKSNVESLESLVPATEKTADEKSSGKPAKAQAEPTPPEVISEYRATMDMLGFLQKKNLELRVKFKSGNRLLALNQEQFDTYDAKRRALITKYPDLVAQAEIIDKDSKNPRQGLFMEKARLAALTAKIDVFESHLKEIAREFGEQYAIGARIEELDRRKQMEDSEYRSLEANLKKAILNGTLDPSRMPNITVVQQPTEPVKSYDKKTTKLILGLAGGGIGVGLVLAFAIELLFDRRVKRPIEIQTRLQLPLLLSIPFIRRKERGGLILSHDPGQPRIRSDDTGLIPGNDDYELAVETTGRRPGHFIMPYSETIRDRIIFNFEVNNITHKPKLVAVTGLSEGAGASTIAAGLAKSFSEIPGTKVLLVDLSSYHPEENPLFGEIPRHSLNGALHLARNTQFKTSPQNLYYASATARRDETGLTTFSPVHLYELMPHLQASQYDYIVFDMPPIDQTSRTLTMAGLMDKVLLVLDAENTSRDGLMWGYSELVKGRADVSCVFNKTRSHVPGWLLGGN